MSDEVKLLPCIEEIWRVADLIRHAEVNTPLGPRSVGYYLSVGLDAFNHPHDRFQELLNAAAKAVLNDTRPTTVVTGQDTGASVPDQALAVPAGPVSRPSPSGFDPSRFQARVDEWLIACFGPEIARDAVERNHRFLEESLELVQACGCSASEAHQLVDYTFGRPVGEIGQEVGGVMNTLAALCLARGLDMNAEGDREMARCWQKIERIREKQRNKPKHSPLPEAIATEARRAETVKQGSVHEGAGPQDIAQGPKS